MTLAVCICLKAMHLRGYREEVDININIKCYQIREVHLALY